MESGIMAEWTLKETTAKRQTLCSSVRQSESRVVLDNVKPWKNRFFVVLRMLKMTEDRNSQSLLDRNVLSKSSK